jgi:hypothetical protein
MMKKCSKCGEEKPATPEFFYRHKSSKYGLSCWCKECHKNDGAERYRSLNPLPEKPKPQPEDYLRFGLQPNDDMRRCTKCDEWKPATTEVFHRTTSRCGLEARCKKCLNICHKQYSEKIKASPKPQYSPEDTKKCHTCGQEKLVAEFYKNLRRPSGLKSQCKTCELTVLYAYRKRRCQTDPTYRLIKNMRNAMNKALSGKIKSSHTLDYVGMELEELWQHFEPQFQPGMTRKNYGEWHVDHIRPIASFKFKEFKGEEFEAALHACWHYTNLQPLWAEDNLRKGAKWDD